MNVFSHIKQQLSILDVVSEYVHLKKAGFYHKGCCPFHQEKTASFTVSPHKEIFYCFGCHAGGDVISFIALVEHCSPLEAAKLLTERYQLSLPDKINFETKEYDKKKRHIMCNELLTTWCHELLLKSPAVLHYLYARGIDKTCISRFKIGYFPGGVSSIKALASYMARHQLLIDDLLEAHIIRKGQTVYYSPFEDRIIFPIADHIGNCCGFGGRIYKKQDTRAKYYNSQENDFFNKGSLLYGLHIAKDAMQKKNSVFLVEGYTDCIAMSQHGYQNTVATLGTACTMEHLKMLTRYVEQVYVVYDNDRAGQQAMVRLTELCWDVDLELKIIQLPLGEDPASYLKKNMDMSHIIKQAKDIFSFFIEETAGNDFSHQSLQHKLHITRKITAIIGKLSDPLKQDILLQQASQSLEIPYQTLKDDLKQQKKAPMQQAEPTKKILLETNTPEALIKTGELEKNILCAILNDASLISTSSYEGLYRLLPEVCVTILKKLETVLQKKSAHTIFDLFEQLDEGEKRLVSQVLLTSEQQQDIDFNYLVTQLQKKHWRATVHAIKAKLEIAKQQGDDQACSELIQEFTALKQMMLEKT